MNNKTTEQLALPLQLRQDAVFETFLPGNDIVAIDSLKYFLEDQEETSFFLQGKSGSGISHLMQAACHSLESLGISSMYIDLSLDGMETDILEAWQDIEFLILDGFEYIVGNNEWEVALFHLFNQRKEQGQHLIIGSHSDLASIELADLRTRLSWANTYVLSDFDQTQQQALIMMFAQSRGLSINEELASYIWSRSARSNKDLANCMAQLDSVSLQEKRKLTLPFVKATMGW